MLHFAGGAETTVSGVMGGTGSGDEEALLVAVDGFLGGASGRTCLLVVDEDVRALDGAIDALRAGRGWSTVNVGVELSAALLREPPRQRPRVVQRWLAVRLAGSAPGPVLVDRIDLLFEPSLALDPVALLVRASRVATLVVAWPGRFGDGVLEYAIPEHAHYRIWRRPETAVVVLK